MNTLNSKIVESISFEELRSTNNVDPESFKIYLEEIYKELSETKKKGINMTRFSGFLSDCPVFVANKLFLSLLKHGGNDKSHLTYEEFSVPLQTIKYGSFEDIAKLIFNIFDFDKDEQITIADMKLLISYLPLKDDSKTSKYYYQMESLNELDEIFKETFVKSKNITFKDFLHYIDSKANIFLVLYCYLLLIIPVLSKKLALYKKRKTNHINEEENSSDHSFSPSSSPQKSPLSSPGGKKLYMSPSLFSPVTDFKEKLKNEKKGGILSELSKKATPKKDVNEKEDSSRSIKELDSPSTPITTSLRKIGVINMNPPTKDDSKDIFKPSKNIKLAESSFLKKQRHQPEDIKKDSEDLSKFVKTNTVIIDSPQNQGKISEFESDFTLEGNLEVSEKELEDQVIFQGDLFKLVKKEHKQYMKSFNLKIIDTSIYYYKTKDDLIESYYKSHYLPGCFIRENKKEKLGEFTFFSFSIIFPHALKQYYHKDNDVILGWIHKLRDAIGYKNFFDFYKMGDLIGEGQFGVIKSGINIKTNEKIAIKILSKESIKKVEDWDLIRTEIDVLKHSKHPTIIKFLDHYENSDYIFIVMELLKEGTLQKYLETKEFNVSENSAAHIAYQIGDALLYLHKYGIIHRDLKPDNILIGNVKKDILDLRLMDFGLSKILGNKEKTAEGYGTLAFVAPEIIDRIPYGGSVDVWSLGVIIHFSLTGEIPFMPDNYDMETMATNICQNPLVLSKKFKNKSPEVADLIKRCLEKDPLVRIKIEDFLNHAWFKKQILSLSK